MYLDTDASGEIRAVVHDVVAASRRRVFAATVDRAEVWRANPTCAHCGQRIAKLDDCAVVLSASKELPPRVAHQTKKDANGDYCFVAAIQAINPTFNVRRASEREAAE